MIPEDDKTPPVSTVGRGAGKTPLPLSIVPRRPPPGRPSGAFTLAEMIERITRNVRSTTTADLDRRDADLRAELGGNVRVATGLGVAALAMNALSIVVSLTASRVLPAGGVSLALAALAALAFGAAKAGARRAPPEPEP